VQTLFLPMLPKKNKKDKKVLLPAGVSKFTAHTVQLIIFIEGSSFLGCVCETID
jgi:hypothetical protein